MKRKIIFLGLIILVLGLGFVLYKTFLSIYFNILLLIEGKLEKDYRIDYGPAQNFVEANNKFAVDLYHYLGNFEKDKNLFFSPISIESVFAMLYEGSDGQAKKEMENVFHFPGMSGTRLGIKNTFAIINNHSNDYKLRIANAIWLQKDFKVFKNYLNNIAKYYYGEIYKVDFRTNPAEAVGRINERVSKKTNGKIPKILEMVTNLTKLVLTNAIYFKGKWAIEFDEKDTKKEDFYLTDGTKIKVDMMYNFDDYRYGENGYLKILELPYKGYLSMIVILPKKKNGINLLEKKLTYNNLQKWLNLFKPGVGDDYIVKVWLPKFKIETTYSNLGNILQSMGLKTIFKWNVVNFPFISDVSLAVDEVVHKAYVDVNEEGTEAAAVTATVVGAEAMLRFSEKEPEVYEFKADHPFIFLIKDNRTGAILFMGKIVNPNS